MKSETAVQAATTRTRCLEALRGASHGPLRNSMTLWRRVRETGVSIIIANEKGRLSRVEIDRMAQRAK